MFNTFDLDIDVLTFDLSKRGQNDFPSKMSTRIRIQHTRKPPYTNFLKMYPKTRTQLKYEFYDLTIVTMLNTILCKTVQLATQCHVGILYINTCSGTFRYPCPTWKFAEFHYLQNVYGVTSAIWCHFYVCYVISQHCSLIITPLCQMMCKFELLLCMLDVYNTLSL